MKNVLLHNESALDIFKMDEAGKRLAGYLSSIVFFILFYVIGVTINRSIPKHLACSVLNTGNRTTNDNGTGGVSMITLK